MCRVQYAVSSETEGRGLSGELLARQLTLLDRPFPEAAEAFKKFCLMSMEQIDEEKQKSSMDACDRALLMIRNGFADPDISLVSVSSQIGVSPNYLSTLIKKRTGSSFVGLSDRTADGTGAAAAFTYGQKNTGDFGKLRLQRSALFQLLF